MWQILGQATPQSLVLLQVCTNVDCLSYFVTSQRSTVPAALLEQHPVLQQWECCGGAVVNLTFAEANSQSVVVLAHVERSLHDDCRNEGHGAPRGLCDAQIPAT